MRILLIAFLFIVLPTTKLFSQEGSDLQLAQYYFSKSEFDKALPYCQKVFQKDGSKFNFNRLYTCYLNTNNEREAEKILKKQISSFPEEFEYPILLGELYEKKDKIKEANKIYTKLIAEYAPSHLTVTDLYTQFRNKGKAEWALKTLEAGRKSLKNAYPLHLEFAEFYKSQNNLNKMLEEYIDYLELSPGNLDLIQNALSKNIDFSLETNPLADVLKEKLLEKVQKNPNESLYAEMLIWFFIQKKQFASAIKQAQALDKREGSEGYRVLEIGNMCVQNKNYPEARKAFKYIIELGEDKQFYYQAEYALLNTRYIEITEQRNYSAEEIQQTIEEYNKVITRIGINRKTVQIIKELAYIKAYYADQKDAAIELVQQGIAISGLTSTQDAELKMLLGDIYVLKNEIWEASLLYMQIDKDFKFDPIGFEAKYKNARIFYYDGDFKFAQSQLDVLKQATTKLIANDAMKLSIFITDNYGLDSNYTAMSKFAKADLLLEQHQYQNAFEIYDSIIKEFPYHDLVDDITFRKAQAMQQQGKWQEAIQYLEELLKYHSDDILADDAIFQLGQINQNVLKNSEKAIEYYKKILFDFKGSLYTSEARKNLRQLRGDKIEEGDL